MVLGTVMLEVGKGVDWDLLGQDVIFMLWFLCRWLMVDSCCGVRS